MSKESAALAKKYENILVTGGAGAIGSNIVKKLLESKGRKIVVVDDLSSGFLFNIPRDGRIVFIRGDITRPKILEKAFQHNIDLVFHLAAHFANQNSIKHPIRDLVSNGIGTLNLLEFSVKHKVKKFIYFSTSCIYKSKAMKLKESDLDLQFETPYAISKYIGEKYVNFYHRFHNLPVIILRIFNSFGPGEKPGQYRNVIPNFMYRGIKNEPLAITGTGKETRNFTFVDDIVRGAFLAAIVKKAIGQTINLGGSKKTSILKLADYVNKLTDNNRKVVFKPRRKWDHSTSRDGDLRLAAQLLGFRARVPLEEGLKHVHSWMLKKIRSKNI